jgi:hypothetical protein
VIRIRYPDFLSGSRDLAGLHGIVERDARGVTLYLLPGLTAGQRKAVIRRLRQEASRGFGPALPLPGLAVALVMDRVRAGVGTAVAVVRLHPAVALLPGAAITAMTLFVLASTGPGPASRTGPDGLLSGNGRLAAAARPAARPVPGTAGVIGPGGSELGSGMPALVTLPRHDRRPGQHGHSGRHRHRVKRHRRPVHRAP